MEPVDQLPTERSKPRLSAVKLFINARCVINCATGEPSSRSLFLPIALYPLVGMLLMQVAQFGQQSQPRLAIMGASNLPSEPVIIEGDKLIESWAEAVGPVKIALNVPQVADEERIEQIQKWIREGEYDAVLAIPSGFRDVDQESLVGLYYSVTNDRSMVARDRAERLLTKLREEIVRSGLERKGIDAKILDPFKIDNQNVAPHRQAKPRSGPSCFLL